MVIIMKKYIAIILGLALIISFILGLYLYKLNNVQKEIAYEEPKNPKEEIKKVNNTKPANSFESKTTPKTKIIKKIYYTDCKHLVQEEEKISNKLINKSESELQIEFMGWQIQKFTENEVIIYKEVNDFCDEHYVLKNIEGQIIVYKLDQYGKIRETVKETGIQTKYLSDIDIENLNSGITVYGNNELSQRIEDFE